MLSEMLSASVDDIRLETETMKTYPAFAPVNTICMGCGCHKSAIRGAGKLSEPREECSVTLGLIPNAPFARLEMLTAERPSASRTC